MSNLKKISDEKLTQVLREHEKWLSSGGKEGRRADLSFTDLRGKNFTDFSPLIKISFVGSDLTKAKIHCICDHVCFDLQPFVTLTSAAHISSTALLLTMLI